VRALLLLPFLLFGCCNNPVPAEPDSDEPYRPEYTENRMDKYNATKDHPDYKLIGDMARDHMKKYTNCCFTYNVEDIQQGWARVHIETIGKNHKSCGTWAVFVKQDDKDMWKLEFATETDDYSAYLDACIEDDRFPCFMLREFKDCSVIDEYKRRRKAGTIGKRPK